MMSTQQQVSTQGMMTKITPFSYSFEKEYTIDDYCSSCSDDHPHHRIIRNQTSDDLTPPQQHSMVQKDFMPTFYNPFETKHRRRTSRAQFKILESSFFENTKPSATMRRWLAQKLGMTPRSVQVWFQNRRAKAKTQLKRQHSSSSFDHARIEPPIEISKMDSKSGIEADHCCCQPFTPSFYPTPTKDQMQWQQQQNISYDPLSVLIDQPDLMSWYSSSPISSPIPSLSSPIYQQMDSIGAVNMTCSPSTTSTASSLSSSSSSPHYHRRSSFPAHFDLIHTTNNKEDNLRRLSEPIFEYQATPFMMMMDLQSVPFQSAPFI